jgi:predicted transposase YbfD/YdcC
MDELGFLDYFKELEDPRCEANKLYSVDELLLLTLCAVICGADGWADVELFGESKLMFLRGFLPYANGIPSDDTVRRFFRAIDGQAFAGMFIQWAQSLGIGGEDRVIAIDGKTSRRSHDGDKKALHMVSAFASEARLVLGQVKTDEKSNEITAIPALLTVLDLHGAIVSIDAMGCQKSIAQKICDGGGDYLLSVKGNQSTLHDDIVLFFEDKSLIESCSQHSEIDGGHGRIETRVAQATGDLEWLRERHDWPNLNSIAAITATVEQKGKRSIETRYYISSLAADPQRINRAVRSHWGIENGLHWVLDMSFNDDQSRIRKENAPQNIAVVKHIALNLLRQAQQKRQSIKGLRKKAGWDNHTLQYILSQRKKA